MSWRVLRRDAGRLARQRKAWIILIGVLLTPALYAWFNISAFWDPYSQTANIRVAVVDLDEGATSDLTGPVNVGKQVTEQLADNDQLGWVFMDEAEAKHALERGDVYATIVIPRDFSADLLSITTGTFTQPALEYRVNEKTSAIAPKITDIGASQLDKRITSTFTEQVAQAAAEALKDTGDDVQLHVTQAGDDAVTTFDSTAASLATARDNLADLQETITSARDALPSAKDTLSDVSTTLTNVQEAIAEAQEIVAEAQSQVIAVTDATTNAYVVSATLLADASAKATSAVSTVTQALGEAGTLISDALDALTNAVEAAGDAMEQLQALVDSGDLDPATAQQLTDVIAALQERNAADQQLLTELTNLQTSTSDAVDSVQAAAEALTTATGASQTAATDLRTALTEQLPALSSAMSQLTGAASAFSSALDAQKTVLTEASDLITGLDTQLESTQEALTSLDDNLASIESGLGTARTDVLALTSASQWGALATLTGLDPDQIAKFIASPIQLDQHVVFPVASYGSAMAALFTNLSLWIGAFVLMVIFKVEVDTEGVEGITVREAYFGRFFLLAILAAAQALIVSLGNLALGVQTASAPAFVGTAVLISLAYLSIIYALCVAFGHVGRGLCILLVIMQIPGASGLYPIELMPDFFRSVYPLLPFSYGIDAMRETIAGFYGAHYWRFMGVLAVFVVLAFVLGLVLRRRLANLNVLFNREIAATNLLVGENVQVTGRGYRLSDVIHALSNRSEYRQDIARRERLFTDRYPTLLRVTLLVGVAGLAVLAALAWALPNEKALVLGLGSLWCLIVIGFLVVIEYAKGSFRRAREVGELDDETLRETALVGAIAGHGAAHAETPSASSDATPTAATATATRVLPVTADSETSEPDATEPEPRETSHEAESERRNASDTADIDRDVDALLASLFPYRPAAEDESGSTSAEADAEDEVPPAEASEAPADASPTEPDRVDGPSGPEEPGDGMSDGGEGPRA